MVTPPPMSVLSRATTTASTDWQRFRAPLPGADAGTVQGVPPAPSAAPTAPPEPAQPEDEAMEGNGGAGGADVEMAPPGGHL